LVGSSSKLEATLGNDEDGFPEVLIPRHETGIDYGDTVKKTIKAISWREQVKFQ
jgi:hypothetical protein